MFADGDSPIRQVENEAGKWWADQGSDPLNQQNETVGQGEVVHVNQPTCDYRREGERTRKGHAEDSAEDDECGVA
jgi:hypothetical protein